MKPGAHSAHPHVLIFDSGVGGFSILPALQDLLPQCRYTYLSDNAGFPYGDKTTDFVMQRVNRVLQASIAQIHPTIDLVIIACNTASTVALPSLRQQLSIPVVGVVPAIKPAAMRSKNRYIGLLATPATINRAYTKELVAQYAADCHVVSVGSTELVLLAEKKLAGSTLNLSAISRILAPFKQVTELNPSPEKLDCLVLACTHFPLLSEEIQTIMGPDIVLIDAACAIAKHTQQLLNNRGLLHKTHCEQSPQLLFTEDNENIKLLQATLKAFKFHSCTYINV